MTEEQATGPAPERPQTAAAASDYYDTLNKKRLDFLLGFLGVPLALALAAGILGALLSALLPDSAGAVAALASLAVPALIYWSYRRGRRYIGIGLIALVVLPFVLAGSCALIVVLFLR